MTTTQPQPPATFDLPDVLAKAQAISDDFNAWLRAPLTEEPAESAHHMLGRAVALLDRIVIEARP